MAANEQRHPQEHRDGELIQDLLTAEPTDYNLSELARFIIRYEDFPGARQIQQNLKQALHTWGLTQEELFAKTRAIHATGEAYKAGSDHVNDWS
jgi:hypothetical protein